MVHDPHTPADGLVITLYCKAPYPPPPDAEAVAVSSYSTVTLAAVGAACVALRSPKSSTITSANDLLSPIPLPSDLKYIYLVSAAAPTVYSSVVIVSLPLHFPSVVPLLMTWAVFKLPKVVSLIALHIATPSHDDSVCACNVNL